MDKMSGRESTKSKQKRQHTNNSQPAIVVKDASVPARDEKLSIQTHHSASKRMGGEQRENYNNIGKCV